MLPRPRRTHQPRANPPSRTRSRWVPVLGILVLTFLVYIPSLGNGFINWDDNFYVTDNPLVAHPTLDSLLTTNVTGNYHPLTMASLALNYKISGLHPGSYHALNLLLHLANVALVFFFVWMLSGGRLWTSVVTALFFGIHPAHVESVAWISERKDVLYAFFYLIALVTYLRYLEGKRLIWLGATLVAFILSVASKPAAVVLPLSLLLIDWFRKRPWRGTPLLEKIPFFAVSVGAGILTVMAQHSVGALENSNIWSPFQRVLFASLGIVMYVAKLFVPVHFSAVYPLPNSTAPRFPTEYYVAPVLVGVFLPAILILFRRVRPVLFGIAFFFINIFLVLQLVTVGAAAMADRYSYLPYVGLLFATAWWLDEPAKRMQSVRMAVAGMFLVLLPVCAVQTWQRCKVWRDSEVFWNDAIAKFPRSIGDAYYNRANHRARVGRIEEALADYGEALVLNPHLPRTWYNRGLLLAQLGQIDSALVSFNRVIQLAPRNVDAWNNRGAMKYRKGDRAGALADFSHVIELNPRYRDGYLNRSTVLFDLGEYARSAEDRKRGIELDPKNPQIGTEYLALGDTMQRMNRHQEAVAALDRAIAALAGNQERLGVAYLTRSRSWYALHDWERARADLREAIRLGASVDPAYRRAVEG